MADIEKNDLMGSQMALITKIKKMIEEIQVGVPIFGEEVSDPQGYALIWGCVAYL